MKNIIQYSLIICFIGLYVTTINAQQLSIQTGHSSTILDLKFSPDGKFLFSSGKDNKVILWDMVSSKQMNIFSGHKGEVHSVVVHPTKNIIATASDDKTVKIWEYPSGKLLKNYDFFTYPVKSVAFKPDGTEIACGANYCYIINLETDKYYNFANHTRHSFDAVAFSPDNKYVAFGGKKKLKTVVYNLYTKELVKKIRVKPNKLLFDEESKNVFAAGNRGNIRKVGLNSFSSLKNYNILAGSFWNSFYSIVLNEEYFIAANKDNLIYVYDKKNGKRKQILKAHTGEVRALAISPDGDFLASAGKDRTIIIWNIEKTKITNILRGGANRVNSISFSEDGKYMFIAYNDGSYRIWNLAQKGKIGYGKAPEPNLLEKMQLNEYTTENSFDYINENKIQIRVNLNKLDKVTDDYISKKENVIVWDIDNSENNRILKNNKTTDYETFLITDTSKIIYVKHKATHSQKYSLLDHTKIKEREQVFSTKVVTYSIPETYTKSKMKLQHLDRQNSIKIDGDIYYKKISPSGKTLLVLKNTKDNKKVCQLWDMKLLILFNSFDFDKNIDIAEFSANEKYIYFYSEEEQKVFLYNGNDFELIKEFDATIPFSFSPNEKYCAYTDNMKNLHLYDIKNDKEIFNVETNHITDISSIKFNMPYNYIATSGYDGLIKFWDINSGDILISLAAFNENDFIYVTSDNYYYSTKGAMQYIGFIVKDKLYSFEQFDLKYNRPDTVLSKLAYSTEDEIKAYNRAYKKRIRKMGFSPDVFNNDFNIPEVEITNIEEFPISTINDKITIKLNAIDSLYNLDRLNIWVNDVPLFGVAGVDLKGENAKEIVSDYEIRLSAGRNKIQASVTNSQGIESLKETFTISYESTKVKPDLFLIAVGVSQYLDPEYNLKYASKDALDIEELFSKQTNKYSNIYSTTLIDTFATAKNVLNMRGALEKTKVDDVVIFFFAGHGVLDWDMNYYLATTELDAYDLENTALRYDLLIDMFDNIPSRNKIIFIDACHSGEVDTDDEYIEPTTTETNSNNNINDGERNIDTELSISSQSSFELMKLMFTDLRRGTGTTIISSAGGAEYAYENEKTKNGIFTYMLKKGINTKKADKNKDGEIMLSELRDYVMYNVSKMTRGHQNPTSRRINLEFDFAIW